MAQHRIEKGKALLIRIQPRRTSPWKHDESGRQVTDLIQQGKAKESSSPWSFPVVKATKNDRTERLCGLLPAGCGDGKRCRPLAQVYDSLAALNGSQWFPTLALASGYWQMW